MMNLLHIQFLKLDKQKTPISRSLALKLTKTPKHVRAMFGAMCSVQFITRLNFRLQHDQIKGAKSTRARAGGQVP